MHKYHIVYTITSIRTQDTTYDTVYTYNSVQIHKTTYTNTSQTKILYKLNDARKNTRLKHKS